jgi:hypothetical protein
MNQRSAVSKINKNGILLVFPINNRKEPKSLWSEFFPRKKMRWEWSDTGDNHVGDLWMLMKRLSDSRQVVYSKWYQGRATFFSRELFAALLTVIKPMSEFGLTRTSRELLEILENDSPLSTKELKKQSELQGRDNEPVYTRSMKALFARLLIVAFGEVDDGAFPSLAVGATKNLFEDLWTQNMADTASWDVINKYMPKGTSVRKYLDKVLAGRQDSTDVDG